MEKQIKEGEVQAVRKDGKGLEIHNEWFMFFKPCFEFKKGDQVKLTYEVNKGFNNIKNCELIKKDVPEIKTIESNLNNEQKTRTATMLTSYVKDILTTFIANSKSYEDLGLVQEKATEEILEAYNKIMNSL